MKNKLIIVCFVLLVPTIICARNLTGNSNVSSLEYFENLFQDKAD
jgi:hypothetical protein